MYALQCKHFRGVVYTAILMPPINLTASLSLFLCNETSQYCHQCWIATSLLCPTINSLFIQNSRCCVRWDSVRSKLCKGALFWKVRCVWHAYHPDFLLLHCVPTCVCVFCDGVLNEMFVCVCVCVCLLFSANKATLTLKSPNQSPCVDTGMSQTCLLKPDHSIDFNGILKLKIGPNSE